MSCDHPTNCRHTEQEHALRSEIDLLTIERDEWKRKFEVAVDLAGKYKSFYEINKRGGYIPTLPEMGIAGKEILKEIEEKLKTK